MFMFQGFVSQIQSAFTSQRLDFLNFSFSSVGEQIKEKTLDRTIATKNHLILSKSIVLPSFHVSVKHQNKCWQFTLLLV